MIASPLNFPPCMNVSIPDSSVDYPVNKTLTERAELNRSDLMSSPVKVLKNVLNKKVSGRLTLGEVGEGGAFWRLHIGQGQLHYAGSVLGAHDRLRYLLHHYCSDLLPQLPDRLEQSEYDWLQNAWQERGLSFNQLRSLLQYLSQDALIQILSLPEASFQFDRNIGLSSILLSMSFKDLIHSGVKSIKTWQRLHSVLPSPLQRVHFIQDSVLSRPAVDALQKLKARSPEVSPQTIFAQGRSLYDLAVTFNLKLVPLAHTLYPLLQGGVLELRPYLRAGEAHRPIVACIDDSATVQRSVKLILESVGYRVNNITQPLSALSSLGREVPDVILLDINMPDMDGYTLCRLLRQCSALKEVPIIMLTGRDALLDKVRARLLGASEYLTKPFEPQALTDIIRQYVSLEAVA